MSEGDGYTPEELKRLGLAGSARFPRVQVPTGGLRPFLGALGPPWPGLGRTILIAIVLTWIGSSLPDISFWRQFAPGGDRSPGGEFGTSAVLEGVLESALGRVAHPIHTLSIAADELYRLGTTWLAVPLSVLTGISLLVGDGAGKGRLLGGLSLAAGLSAVGIVIFGPPGGTFTVAGLAFPGPVLSLAGGTFVAWLLLRTAGPGPCISWRRAAPVLIASAILMLNVDLLLRAPELGFAWLLGADVSIHLPDSMRELVVVSDWTVAILGFPLILLPALVVRERLGFRAGLGCLGRALRQRPVPLLTAYAILLALVVLPVREIVLVPFLVSGLVSAVPDNFPSATADAMGHGVGLGLLVYATALMARALVATEPASA